MNNREAGDGGLGGKIFPKFCKGRGNIYLLLGGTCVCFVFCCFAGAIDPLLISDILFLGVY